MAKNSEKKFKCEICEKNFASNNSKSKHLTIVHGEEKKLICNVCTLAFGVKKELTVHVKNNHKRGHHPCKKCGKIFAGSSNLMNHIKIVHEGEKYFKCDYCGKGFGLSTDLKRHLKSVHEGTKDQECPICYKTFSLKHHVNNHIKKVHESQKNKCDYCDKTFYKREQLRVGF